MLASVGAIGIMLMASTPHLLLGQVTEVQLLYKEGGLMSDRQTVTVTLTDPNGAIPPDTAAVQTDDRLYFLYRPAGNWTFSEKAVQTLQEVVIEQKGTRIKPVSTALLGGIETINAIRVAYPRDQIDWRKPLSFAHKVDTSATFSLPEVYTAEYPTYRQSYEKGRQLLADDRPLQAIDTLSVFHGDKVPSYKFVSDARDVLDDAAQAVLSKETDAFKRLRKEAVTSPSDTLLRRITQFRIHLDSAQASLNPYLEVRPDAGAALKQQMDTLDSSAATLYDDVYEMYREETIRVFLKSSHEEKKPALFIDLLTRILLTPDPPRLASEGQLDGLSPTLLDDPQYAEARQILEENQWIREFRDVLNVVDKNLRWKDRLFGDKVLKSLRLMRTSAPQPYYEIWSALHATARADTAKFNTHWQNALSATTDISLLRDLQHWHLASGTAPPPDSVGVAVLVDKAERFRTEGKLDEARRTLERAEQQNSEYPPLLYERGRLHQAQGDTTAAHTHYERAYTADSNYVVPALADFRLLFEQEKYDKAISRANAVLETTPYWLVYFAKARALGKQERYDEATTLLTEHCESLNDKNYALYALLGELYAKQEKWERAAWVLQEADAYSPRRSAFVSRLDSVRTQIQNTDEASLDDE